MKIFALRGSARKIYCIFSIRIFCNMNSANAWRSCREQSCDMFRIFNKMCVGFTHKLFNCIRSVPNIQPPYRTQVVLFNKYLVQWSFFYFLFIYICILIY